MRSIINTFNYRVKMEESEGGIKKVKHLPKKLIIIIVILLVFSIVIFVNLNNRNSKDVWNGNVVEVEIKASNWKFEPNLVEVNFGDKVELHMESIEGTNGIVLPQFKVSETLVLGEDIHVEFIADKKGTFSFYCSVPCGSGHSGMNGILVVN